MSVKQIVNNDMIRQDLEEDISCNRQYKCQV